MNDKWNWYNGVTNFIPSIHDYFIFSSDTTKELFLHNFTFLGIYYLINIDFPFLVASMVVSLPNLARTDVPFIVAVIALGLSSNFFFLTRLDCNTPAYSHASPGSPVSESVVVDVAGRLTAAPSRLNTDCSCNHIELMHMLRPFYSPLTKWWRWFSVMCVCLLFCLSTGGPHVNTTWTWSNMFTWDPPPFGPHCTALPPDTFKLVHYETRTVSKRAVGIGVKCLLV